MQTYHFDEIVSDEGVVTLSGLPPLAQVVVVVIQPDVSDWQERMQKLMQDVSENHPFAKMSKEEILVELRKTRERIAEEEYGNVPCVLV
jgi:DNA integrity scanning protein DisA with diadenylate cyclase activity